MITNGNVSSNSRETVSLLSITDVHDVLPEGRRQECRPGWVSVRRTQTFYSQTAAPEHMRKDILKGKVSQYHYKPNTVNSLHISLISTNGLSRF
jgi:hypothetical protein